MVLSKSLAAEFERLDDDVVDELGRIGLAYATLVGYHGISRAAANGRVGPVVQDMIVADLEIMRHTCVGAFMDRSGLRQLTHVSDWPIN